MCIIAVNINLIKHIQQVNLQMHSTVSILYSQILKSTKGGCFIGHVLYESGPKSFHDEFKLTTQLLYKIHPKEGKIIKVMRNFKSNPYITYTTKIKIKCLLCEMRIAVCQWGFGFSACDGRVLSPVSWWACSHTEPSSPPSAPTSPSAHTSKMSLYRTSAGVRRGQASKTDLLQVGTWLKR